MANNSTALDDWSTDITEEGRSDNTVTLLENAVKEFVQTVRNKIGQSLNPIITREEKRRIESLLEEADRYLRGEFGQPDRQQYGEILTKMKRMFYPLERRLFERRIAVDKFQKSLHNLREWLRAEKSFMGTEDEWLSKHQLERLEQLLQLYENWFLEKQQQTVELPEEFAMNTAQIVARQHAMEVEWHSIIDGDAVDEIIELDAEKPECTIQDSPYPMIEVACQSTSDRGDTEVIIETNAGRSESSTPYMYGQDAASYTSTISLARHSMEIYINEMTEKLHGPLTAFVSTAERYNFLELLKETKEWLRFDSAQSSFQEFQDRLNRLETIGLLIEKRLLERVELVKEFKTSIEHYRRILAHIRAGDPFYVNLEPSKIEQLATSLDQYENWLREHQLKQQSIQSSVGIGNNDGPHLGTMLIAEKLQSLRNIWNSLITVDDLVPVCDVMIGEEKTVIVDDSVNWPTRSPANWRNYREPNLYTITIKLRGVPRSSDKHAFE
ncbi:hypothetical protein EG68_06949 [Paragonimus skrjabini miyazakii]|uniref:Uncharacterized protein n=1 Tax=Paragonimus skrjabini miyazakii TaxID=59628 RepID=A0A8S9YN49_9TREM|nr:hypothetical protein EG68_06949 [Paragonimus skrjabini miyazakii]